MVLLRQWTGRDAGGEGPGGAATTATVVRGDLAGQGRLGGASSSSSWCSSWCGAEGEAGWEGEGVSSTGDGDQGLARRARGGGETGAQLTTVSVVLRTNIIINLGQLGSLLTLTPSAQMIRQ